MDGARNMGRIICGTQHWAYNIRMQTGHKMGHHAELHVQNTLGMLQMIAPRKNHKRLDGTPVFDGLV